MPQINIDGTFYPYEPGAHLLQFTLDLAHQDVEIPYFCYHPAMSVPTNCRMCLVEVGAVVKDRATGEVQHEADGSPKIAWGKKPVTACNQAITPDMYVRTKRTSAVVEKAEKGVLEFMLINHPLDCPICDQAGQCPLQIWTYKYGPEGSRFEVSKVHKPKHIQLGPQVTLDAERCINCTRCTRFTEEISHSNQLSINARGDNNYPTTAPGATFDDPYSINVVDICPVGALTQTDFRFKARAWEMNYTPGICTGCATGCNTDVWLRDDAVLRLTPRHNPEVNNYWMCDAGRLDYQRYNQRRVSGVKLRGDLPTDFETGFAEAARLLTLHKGKTLFIGSAYASVESNYALKQLAQGLGSTDVYYATHIEAGWGDDFLRKDDRTPNKAGCELLGFKELDLNAIRAKLDEGEYELVYLVEDHELAEFFKEDMFLLPFIVHGSNYFTGYELAAVLLPAATAIESPGIYINAKGLPQLTRQAKQIRRMTPDMWMAMSKSRLDAGGVAIDNWRHPEHIVDCLPSWLLLARLSAELKIEMPYVAHSEIFEAVRTTFGLLKDMKLPRHNRKESFKQSQFEFAIN